MLRPVVPPRALLVLAACLCGFACGDEADTAPGQRAPADTTVDIAEQLLEGDPLEALALLRRPHAAIREQLGPHSLVCKTTLALAPKQPADPNPPLDSAVPPDQSIADEVALRWETPDETGPRFALEQHNDKERGRSVVMVDGMLYAKLEHGPWTFHTLESEVHELWLDDAWRAGHDMLKFLLPGATLTVEAAPGEGWQGGDAVRLTLAPGRGVLPPGRDSGWRAGVAFSALSGTLLVDAGTGAWLSVDASATYSVEGGAGGPLAGQFEVHGRLASTLPAAPAITRPKDAVALPERHRYEEERKRLLDGLAAP